MRALGVAGRHLGCPASLHLRRPLFLCPASNPPSYCRSCIKLLVPVRRTSIKGKQMSSAFLPKAARVRGPRGRGARPGGTCRRSEHRGRRPAPEHTFHQLVYERAQVVGLLLLPFTHLDDVSEILADILQQLGAHLHFSLEESEQRVLRWFAPKAERREEGLEEAATPVTSPRTPAPCRCPWLPEHNLDPTSMMLVGPTGSPAPGRWTAFGTCRLVRQPPVWLGRVPLGQH